MNRLDSLPITELAAAKVNLTLHVLGRRSDGYHELASLVAFADFGDRLDLVPAAAWRHACTGPTASAIEGVNLIERAADAVRAAWPEAATGQAELYKMLPVAAGIGGGSSDAAATLRALRRLNEGRVGEPDWATLAHRLGSDVSVCLIGRLAFMRGVGDRIDPIAMEERLPAVLVNPGVALPTARVFADLAAPPLRPCDTECEVPAFTGASDLLTWVTAGRNDLEPPALRLAPIVGRVRAALQAARGCQLARLSGSGPTCFGLFGSDDQAAAAAREIADYQPDWWVRATRLG